MTSRATATRSAVRFRFHLAGAVVAALLLSLASSSAPGAPVPARPAAERSRVDQGWLRPGEVRDQALGGGEEHRYRAELAAGPWLVAVEQLGVSVELLAVPPGGEAGGLLSDSPLHRDGIESLLLEPTEKAVWDVVVRAEADERAAGRYRLSLEALSAQGERDRRRLAAERSMSDAGVSFGRDDPESSRRAAREWRRAAELWRALDEPRQAARADHCAGEVARRLSELQEAEEALRRAAAAWRSLGEPLLAVEASNQLGLALWQGGDLPAAQAVFEAALAADVGEQRPALDASTRNNLCLVLHSRGELDAARRCYEEALPRAEAMDDADLLATLSTNLGGVHYLLGEPEPALRHFGRALELRRARHEDRGEADVLNNLAALHMATGDFQEALLGYERTLEIYRQLEDVRGEARTLNNLGNVYQRLGDHERARTHYESALPLRRRAQDARGEAVTLNNLGNLLRLDGEPREALARHRAALELRGAQGHRRGEGLTLQLMGRAHLGLGDAPAALDHLGRAAEALREVGDRRRLAETQRYRGEALVIAGRRGEAAAALAEALDLFRGAGDRSGEATVQIALAGVERAADRPAAALERLQAAIDLLEGLRAGLDAPDLRASYLASQRAAFEQLVDLHVAAGRIERALEVAEAASARSLLDVVQGAGADLPRSIDPALAARRDALERELRIKIDRRLDVDEAAAPQQVARLEGEIDALLTGLDAAEARLRGASARYAELTRPPILTAAEMQELLEPGTVALRYSLGEERSWLWRLGRAGIAVYELPPRRRLEELGRAVHEAMSTPAVAGDDADPSAAAAELAQLLLGPVTLAPGTDRLLVIADGALHYLPFAALPMPGEPAAVLLDRYELVTAPSMSVLALQRRALGRRRAAGGTLAVVADPVFDAADHRVSLAATAAGSDGAVRRGGGFARLRFSRREADAIAALVAPPQRLLALDFEASRDTVMGGALEPFRIVHFATHGVLDAQRPELSGLMLSRVDAAGRSRLGLLGLRDIYELPLAADLVVLSGCRTALGREVRGEGLVGLTRGFLYAGVPRVVASLWQVDDRATAALMERFYRGVLADGLAPGEALRRAQLGLRADPRTRDPYYWGAFLLQGDWRRSPPAEGNHAAAADTLH